MIGVATNVDLMGGPVDADLDTLATARYVTIDELLQQAPQLAPWRPAVGIAPKLSDAELVTLAVLQALLGFTSEARWLRHADRHLRHLFPYLPRQAGYNKRLRRAAGLLGHAIRAVATDTGLWTDDVWLVDSTPVECGRSRETTKRSALAGWAQYGYCASYSRYFWGLRLHLVCTLHGLPVALALTGAKADERQVLLDLLAVEPELLAARPGQTLLAEALLRPRVPADPGRAGRAAVAASSQGRAPTARCAPVQAIAAIDRVGQRHLQGPAGPRTTRRPYPWRGRRPGPAAHPGPGRRHLAQPQDQTAHPTVPDRLRPLTLESII
jgi:Transposase DDE domain